MRTLLSVDDALKSEIDLLQARGELRNTLFVVTSDNGFLLGEHRVNSRKRLAYEAAQVATWVAGPDFPAGLVGTIQGLILFFALGGEVLARYRIRRRTRACRPATAS